MPIVYLLRHGESESNVEERYQGHGESPLTPKGIQDAERARDRLKHVPFVAAFSSDLSRAFQTASIVAKPHRKRVEQVRDLRERYYGAWEGLNFSDIAKRWPTLYPKWLKNPEHARIPQAETLAALQRRAVRTFRQLVRQFDKHDTLLMVAHGGWNRALLFHYLGLELNRFWSIRQSNGGINVIELRSPPTIRTINA